MHVHIHLIMTVVGAMVTHQVGSGVRAAVLHLLSESLFSPLSLSPLLAGPLSSLVVLSRQYTKKKESMNSFLTKLIDDFLVHIVYCIFFSSQ